MKLAALMGSALIAWSCATTVHADTCENVLKTGAYNCNFVGENGQTFPGCMRFVFPGEVGEFDIRSRIEFPSGARNLLGGCSCRAKGSLKKAKFDEAKTFDCLEAGRDAFLVSGNASKSKIGKGQTMTPDGDSIIFTCARPRGDVIGPAQPCRACTPAGQPCAGGPCCEGLVCNGVIGGPATCG